MSNVLLTVSDLYNLRIEAYLQKQITLCRIVDHKVPKNETKGFICQPETFGRFLRITKNVPERKKGQTGQTDKRGHLVICEVEVYGSQGT